MNHFRALSLVLLLTLMFPCCLRAVGDEPSSQSSLQQLLQRRIFVNQNIPFSHFDEFFEDQQGRLWGCTFGGELTLWNGTAFVRQAHVQARVYCFLTLSDHELLIGHERGLSCFDTESLQVTAIADITEPVHGIYERPEGGIRVFTRQGVWTGDGRHFDRICHWRTMDIVRTERMPEGRYLLMTPYDGLWQYDFESNALTPLEMTGIDPKHEVMLDLLLDGNRIWVGTDRGVYTATLRQGARLECDETLRGLTGKYLMKSSRGELWVGTDRGLYVRTPGEVRWQTYRRDPFSSITILNDCVWSLYEDHTGDVWVGVESGVSFTSSQQDYNFVNWTFGQYQQGNRVICMLHDSRDRLWMGGPSGLSMHDFRTGRTLLFDKMSIHNCVDNRIWSITEDREGLVWICTDESVAYYDEQAETFMPRLVTDFESGLTSKWAYRILDAGDGYMWIASGSGGFLRVRREVLLGREAMVTAECAFNSRNSTHTLGEDVGLRLHQCADGSVWGLGRMGFYILSEAGTGGQQRLAGKPQPQPVMADAYEMVSSSDDGIWALSNDSLFYYDPQTCQQQSWAHRELGMEGDMLSIVDCNGYCTLLSGGCVAILDRATGIATPMIEQHDSEYRNCYWDAREEMLWLGGVDYCMVASLPRLQQSQEAFSRPVHISTHILEGNDLSIQFSNDRPSEWSVPYSGYYYRLLGHDTQWLPINRGMNIRMESLAPGDYTLQLGRRAPRQLETELLEQLPVEVPYPWYRSWWFYALCILSVALIILNYVRHYSLTLQLRIAEADRQQLLEQYQCIKEATLTAVEQQTAADGASPSDSGRHITERAQAMAQEQRERLEAANRRWLEQLKQQVEKHLGDEDFNVARLAELSGLNEKALYRRVKALTGSTTVDYIRQLRMQHAAALLQHPELSTGEVMYMVGFTSASYFSKCFEAAYGMTPSEYRAKHATDNQA